MTKTETIYEMIKFLSRYEYADGMNYDPTEYGCGVIFDTEMRNKGALISKLEKHPRYNGRFQIVLDESFHRDVDHNVVKEFTNYIYNFTEKSFQFTFVPNEVVRVKSEIPVKPSNWVEPMDDWVGKEVVTVYDGSTSVRCKLVGDTDTSTLAESWWFQADTLERLDGSSYITKSVDEKLTLEEYDFVRDLIDDGQYLSDEMTEKANMRFDWLRAHSGQKMSRIVKKICDHFGISKDDAWNRKYTRFADACNPLEVKTWTIISWHPVDYWAMSFGNSWTSCHSVDKTDLNGVYSGSYHGCYSGGTESYMLDPSSVVVYVVDRSYEGNEFEFQPKVLRQMFHIAEDGTSFVQGRLYPQDNDCGSKEKYDKMRAIMQRVISECFGTLNYWDVKKGTSACSRAIDSCGVHYRDYEYFDNCTLSTLKEGHTGARIEVGHDPICPDCGVEHGDEECIQCSDCREEGPHCEECGDPVDLDGNGIHTADDHYFCDSYCAERAGYVWCANDEAWHYNDNEVCYDDWLCEYVYDYYEDFVRTEDGHTYLDADNAEADGYRYVEGGGWYPVDEVKWNEETCEYELSEEVA